MILQAFLVRYGKTSKYLKHNDEFLVGRRAFIWEYPVTENVVSVSCSVCQLGQGSLVKKRAKLI